MKSRRVGHGIIAAVAAMMSGLSGGLSAPKSYSPKWQGVMRKSVALQNHRGACNRVRKHAEKQANARRRKQMYGEYGGRY